jgi:hypothetical protein
VSELLVVEWGPKNMRKPSLFPNLRSDTYFQVVRTVMPLAIVFLSDKKDQIGKRIANECRNGKVSNRRKEAKE